MEAIATDAAVDAAKSLIKTMASKAFEEIGLIWGFNDDLERLKKKLSYIEALMEDLGKRKREERRDRVNHWLKDVKEVACFAENLVNDHAYEMLRRKHSNSPFEGDCIYCVHNLIDEIIIKCPIVFRVQMTYRVKEIMSMFDELEKVANTIGLNPVDLANNAVSTTASTSAADTPLSQIRRRPPTQVFIGRDKDKRKLVEMMLSSPNTANQHTTNTIPIIAIVGLGGLGKTTLARKLHEGDEGGDWHFDGEKVWICVSENFNCLDILKEMVESVTGKRSEVDRNADTIIKKLQDYLKGKKLFLVLDDVWNEDRNLWGSLNGDLNRIGVATGSVILITTRNEKVATAADVGASQLHKLEWLSDEDAMELLKQQVSFDPSFDEVVKRILQNCAGMPLAINAIGGILKSKNEYEWYQIEKSEEWNIPQDVKNTIMPYLLLTYNHFNDVSLKQCFAYCAIYPKDKVMEKGELISLWLAQGLLHHHDQDRSNNTSTTTMETIGEKYIDILVDHSFLLLEGEDYRTKYKMHDLVHDLATHVLKNDLLVWKAGTNLNDVSHVRHLAAVNLKDNEGAPKIVTLPKKEKRKLRTVIFWNCGVQVWKSLNGARYLCTLIMVDIGLEEVPPIIGQFVHLRYLDLSHNDKLKSLPESICNLYQLQTLRLLRCWYLEELPRQLHKLKNLRHILVTKALWASKGLQELTILQTLPPLELRAEEGWKIDELGPLNQLKGEIRIHGLANVKNKEEATKACLERKDEILHFSLEWRDYYNDNGLSNDEDVLEGLEPHPKIQSLSVDKYKGVKFPEWIMKMSVKKLQTGYLTHLRSLTKVKLLRCYNCQQLPSLGQLPNLKVLELTNFDKVECIGDEFYKSSNNNCREQPASARVGDKIFQSLKILIIENFDILTTWAAPSSALEAMTAFPSLETLKVVDCPQLETTPYVQPTCLKHVVFHNVRGTPLDMAKSSNGLIKLYLHLVPKMRMLPEELSNCSNLQSLEIIDCENLECIPNGLTSLKTLKVKSCPSLSSIPHGLSSLKTLKVKSCPSLSSIHVALSSLRNLSMWNCPNFKALTVQQQALPHYPPLIGLESDVPDLSQLKRLEELSLFNAGEMMMTSAARSIPQLDSLWKLEIGGFKDEEEITKFVSQIKSTTTPHSHSHSHSLSLSLRDVTLMGCPKVKKMPEQLQHLLPSSTLQDLTIREFDELEQLPDWIGNTKILGLYDCKKLKYLPSKQAMMHISELYIYYCPELKERCKKHRNDNGPPHSESQLPNIEHIPLIYIV